MGIKFCAFWYPFWPILTLNIFFKYSPIFFLSSRSIWVSKNAEFYAYSKSEDEIEKKWTNKSYFKKLAKKLFLRITFLSYVFFNFAFGFGISVKFCIFWYPNWPISGKKFSALFLRNIKWSTLLNSMVLSRSGEGGAKFLLECHTFRPLCRTSFVVQKSRSSI